MKSNITHPETRDNEVYLGNTSMAENFPPAVIAHLKTLRLGVQPCDIYGNIMTGTDARPIFIDKSEAAICDRIMVNLR